MKVGIVGLGLIGGSLGMDLRACGHEVWGYSQRASTVGKAIVKGAVDVACPNWADLAPAEVIFLCTPIGLLVPTAQQLIPHLNAGTVLTDVGSVKASIVETLEPLWPNFVGGHPMAGTAKSGIEAAFMGLFKGNPYVLTPSDRTPPSALAQVETLVTELGADLFHCAPADHDRAVAWISHLPVMTSASLIAACLGEADPQVRALAQRLASSGFRDTSRVGGGNPELGVMMAQFNRSALLSALQAYRGVLDGVIDHVEQGDWAGLESLLRQTQQARSDYLREPPV
jgi:arogenate dehydrogenase (NADP+)